MFTEQLCLTPQYAKLDKQAQSGKGSQFYIYLCPVASWNTWRTWWTILARNTLQLTKQKSSQSRKIT